MGLVPSVLTRRRSLKQVAGAGAAMSLAGFLAACGGDDDPSPTNTALAAADTSSSSSTTTLDETAAPTASAPDDTNAFPITIDHKYGSVTIKERPQRVLTIGFSEQDPVLALGVKPIAVRDWFGDESSAAHPWASGELGSAEPEVLNMPELDFERIAALGPDLIVSIYTGISKDEYRTLSEIAPTVAQPDDYVDYGAPWQVQTLMIGRALGKEAEAENLIDGLESEIAAVREDHPEFSGVGAIAAYSFNSGELGVYRPEDPRGRFLTSIGLAIPDEIIERTGDAYYAKVSSERMDLLDADVLDWVAFGDGAAEAIQDDALYRQLDAHTEGRDVFLDEDLLGSLSFSTILSLPYALENLVPKIAAAIDGDPNTNA